MSDPFIDHPIFCSPSVRASPNSDWPSRPPGSSVHADCSRISTTQCRFQSVRVV